MTSGLCLPLQFSLPVLRSVTVCGLDCLFTLDLTLGYLPFSLYTFTNHSWSLARDYPANGFPEFDRSSHTSFPVWSP